MATVTHRHDGSHCIRGYSCARACVRTRVDVRIIVTVRDGKLVSPYGARLGYRHRSEVACDGNVTVCYGSYIHC